MIDFKKIEQLARQVQDSLPKDIRDLSKDVEKKIFQALKNKFFHMNFISREEFETYTNILLQIQEHLKQLELRTKKLEEIIKNEKKIMDKHMNTKMIIRKKTKYRKHLTKSTR